MGVLAHESVGGGDRHPQTHAAHDWQVRQVITEKGDLLHLHRHPGAQFSQGSELVFTALDQVLDAEVGGATFHQGGLAAADDGGFHAGGDQQLDAVAVQGIEGLELGAVGHEVQPPVGKHTVHIEDREANVAGPFQQCQIRVHTTPALSRSCMLSAPTGLPSPSTTNSPLILPSSMIFNASAASTPWRAVLQRGVITCSMGALRMSMS